MDLHVPIHEAGRLFKTYASRLEKLGIVTLGDFLTHFPFRYDNFSLISKIGSVQAGEIITIQGEVIEITNQYLRSHRTLQKAKVSDGTGELEVTWFNQPYIPKTVPVGTKISLSGRVNEFHRKKTMESPDYEVMQEDLPLIHTGRLVPVYPETRGVSSKWLRRQINKILISENVPPDFLPESTRSKHSLMSLKEALLQIHFPDSYETAQEARKRLAFEELFLMQIGALLRRKEWNKKVVGNKLSLEKFKKNVDTFISSLPF
jgi:ATP-dependent DNA helicase RecG